MCRTGVHLADGELAHPKLPLILGHQLVGRVVGGTGQPIGTRVGVPWLGTTCTVCDCCVSDRENLCPHAQFTGYQLDGGFAEYAVADHRFCFPLPDAYDDPHSAPLLCAGLIGYRSLRLAGRGERLGI